MRDRRYRREIGVIIPQDLDPQEWAMYTLCAPNDIEWANALRSAVRMMSRGRYWLRDDRESSIKNAQLIGGEIERSLEMCTIDFQPLADAIIYLTDNLSASVVNQQSVNCGGGNCGGGSVLDEPDGQDETVPVDIVPPVATGDATTLQDQEKCSLAHFLADMWVNNFVDIKNYWAGIAVGITTVTTWLQEKFPEGAIIPFVAMILTSLAVALETALLANLADNMADAAQSQHDAIICAVYSANSPAEAKANFESVIADSRAQYGKTTYVVLILVAQMLDWNKIMGGEVIVPASYDGADCSDCTDISPEGFELVPAVIQEITGQTAGTGVSSLVATLGPGGVSLSITAVANGASRNLVVGAGFVAPPDRTVQNSRYKGFTWKQDGVNHVIKFQDGTSSLGYSPMWDGGNVVETGIGRDVLTREGTLFPTDWEFGDFYHENNGMNLDSCSPSIQSITFGATSIAAGDMAIEITDMFWIAQLDDPC